MIGTVKRYFKYTLCLARKYSEVHISNTMQVIAKKYLYIWYRPRTHGNVFLRFCMVSSNELIVLDSLENSKQYKNAGKRFRVYGALVSLPLDRMTSQTWNCCQTSNYKRNMKTKQHALGHDGRPPRQYLCNVRRILSTIIRVFQVTKLIILSTSSLWKE